MLNTHYRYISFDFETTGLDTTKDEPLQIGIVEFDHDCKVIATYQSLIKPTKPISELKEIVRYVTGFKLTDLEDAPSYESLLPEISTFFDETTVIVGQNISFDLAFLHRILPDFQPAALVDTFHRSKMMRHFQSSYALDVTANTLLKKDLLDTEIVASTDQAHDALHDSLTALAVYKATLTRLHTIRRKYLLVDYCIQRNDGIYNQLLKRTEKNYKFEEKELFFPPLKKNLPPERSLVAEEQTKKHDGFDSPLIDCSTGSITQLLDSVDRTAKSWIIATNSRSKATIIRQYFDAHYLPTSTLHSQTIFEPERIDRLLHKAVLSDSEIGFILKYYSHHQLGHSMVDVNTSDEYTILHALTSRKSQRRGETLITTHDHLLSATLDQINSDSHLLLLDHDRRIQSLKRKVSQPFDMDSVLSLVEKYHYEADLMGQTDKVTHLKTYQSQLNIFLGVLGSGLDTLFRGYAEKFRPCDFLIDDTRFQGVKPLRERLLTATHDLIPLLSESQTIALQAKINRLEELITDTCQVEKKMYHGDKWFYVLKSRDPYLDYEEFLALLPTVASTTAVSLKSGDRSQSLAFPHPVKRPQILSINRLGPLDRFLSTYTQPVFIFSGAKHISQSVFKDRIAKNYQDKWTIIGENITGGVGKNLYLAEQGRSSGKPLLAIGGYHFFMALTEKKFAFPTICMYYSKGTMTPQIITDFVWWSGR